MKTKNRILIVDDELSVRSSLEEWFLEDGFEVETAEDGEAALRTMHTAGPFDVFVIDIRMPGMDGITLQKRVHALPSKL
jgi:DNA-binding NtrC family response regulator